MDYVFGLVGSEEGRFAMWYRSRHVGIPAPTSAHMAIKPKTRIRPSDSRDIWATVGSGDPVLSGVDENAAIMTARLCITELGKFPVELKTS
jgi:hypothetical protein